MLIDTVRCRNKNEVHSWVNSISKEYESKREHHRYARWAAVRAEYRSRQFPQIFIVLCVTYLHFYSGTNFMKQ
jgi:glutaredoxin